MARETVNDLIALLAVARERSFTRAAAQFGVSQPALSRIIRDLEARLGLRLLTRNTRSVAPTEAGERLIQTVGPHFDGIEAGLAAVTAMRGKPAGSLRITSVEHASDKILAPAVARLLTDYPDIRVEIINDYGLTDIVAGRFDAGVYLGEQVAKDMIALRIGPDFHQALVGAPSYFARRTRPDTPHDLTAHACINLRLPTSGGLWTWPFAKDRRELKVRAEGPLAFNAISLILNTALSGLGLAYLPEDVVQQHVAAGRLVRVLADWSAVMTGYHLYYPNRQPSRPLPCWSRRYDTVRQALKSLPISNKNRLVKILDFCRRPI
jgi:DNA-binding transcriptional LysR family regulator